MVAEAFRIGVDENGLGSRVGPLVVTAVLARVDERGGVALRRKLPKNYWIVFNDLLVAYGQNLCKPISPFCSRCKIVSYCCRVGVKVSR